MKNEKESVHNYLTTPKLITGQLKQKPRLNPNDSMFSGTSSRKRNVGLI